MVRQTASVYHSLLLNLGLLLSSFIMILYISFKCIVISQNIVLHPGRHKIGNKIDFFKYNNATIQYCRQANLIP